MLGLNDLDAYTVGRNALLRKSQVCYSENDSTGGRAEPMTLRRELTTAELESEEARRSATRRRKVP